jgi:hypothetical protein
LIDRAVQDIDERLRFNVADNVVPAPVLATQDDITRKSNVHLEKCVPIGSFEAYSFSTGFPFYRDRNNSKIWEKVFKSRTPCHWHGLGTCPTSKTPRALHFSKRKISMYYIKILREKWVPIGNFEAYSFSTGFPFAYNNNCSQIWENLFKSRTEA